MANTTKGLNKFEHEIIGESPQIIEVINTAKKIARTSSITTLITGESGTGKELFARLIHNHSDAANQPFVDINCAAIPETLLESELFGYEKGAFTGAHISKKGLFELANSGSIFLDEIGDITSNFQIKILKAVETKRFRRISGLKEVEISTRIIAATNADLKEAVKAGKFREDLYYRLNVCEITIPPLRERGKDVLILAQHFIDHYNREFDRQVKGLSPSAIENVQNYPWPGNIRQLKNSIERAVLVESDEWIEPDDISLDYRKEKRHEIIEPVINTTNKSIEFNRFEIPDEGISIEEVERGLILSALEKANGNISKTAKLLRINRGKLRYKLERMDVPSDLSSSLKLKPQYSVEPANLN
ncbi:sigma-54-dependent Fis family transcriptional regulator [candidate division KSB1 bacterium]|nr:sigma-54-dependent Fis family transcriptional regulator [candidate division KSB1 bacterium]